MKFTEIREKGLFFYQYFVYNIFAYMSAPGGYQDAQ